MAVTSHLNKEVAVMAATNTTAVVAAVKHIPSGTGTSISVVGYEL